MVNTTPFISTIIDSDNCITITEEMVLNVLGEYPDGRIVIRFDDRFIGVEVNPDDTVSGWKWTGSYLTDLVYIPENIDKYAHAENIVRNTGKIL